LTRSDLVWDDNDMPPRNSVKTYLKNTYYHVYNRGVEGRVIFHSDLDYKIFLSFIKRYLTPSGQNEVRPRWRNDLLEKVALSAYCLMPNHFHFLIRQNTDIPTSKLMKRVCTSYSMNFNKKYERVGHVFQGRFKQVPIVSNAQLLWTSAYIHNNPKLDGFVKNIKDYKWSSLKEFECVRLNGLCSSHLILEHFKDRDEFFEFTKNSFEELKKNKEARIF